MDAVRIADLNHAYGEGENRKQILFGVNLAVAPGEVVFLMGPSGCGKTTILTLVGALRSVQDGSVEVLGAELLGATEKKMVATRRRIGFVFQAHNLHPALTALENVRMGLEATGARPAPDDDTRCRAALAAVGIADHVAKRQDKLSGGQRQRVAIARALVGDPGLLLADEPTAALDGKTGHEVVGLVRDLARLRRMAVLMVTHDNRILDFADRVVAMEDGRILDKPMVLTATTLAPQHPAIV